jgi:hypothetical protein
MPAVNELRDHLLQWLQDMPAIFVHEEIPHGIRLVEIDTKKQKDIIFAEVLQWRETPHPEGMGRYLNLVFEDEHELVLCYMGFAFSPSLQSTGPIPDLPPVLCFYDIHRLLGHADHLSKNPKPDEKPEAVKTLMIGLAALEGARLLGFDVGEEEKKAEEILEVLEKS